MRHKCVRCERACHAHDKIVVNGVKCCTDCAKEVVGGTPAPDHTR